MIQNEQTPSNRRFVRPAAEIPWSLLTDEDRPLFLLAISGRNDREIAARLGGRPSAVRSNVQTLLDKLGLKDRLTLVLAAATRNCQATETRRADSNGLQKDCLSVMPRGLKPGAWKVEVGGLERHATSTPLQGTRNARRRAAMESRTRTICND